MPQKSYTTAGLMKCLYRTKELMWMFEIDHITQKAIVENMQSIANNCT